MQITMGFFVWRSISGKSAKVCLLVFTALGAHPAGIPKIAICLNEVLACNQSQRWVTGSLIPDLIDWEL